MNRTLWIMLSLILLAAGSLPAQNQDEFSVPLSRSGETAKINVEIKKGPITVKGTARQDVLVRYKNIEDPKPKVEEAPGGLKRISGGQAELEVIEKDNEVFITSESWNKGMDIYVEVPLKSNLELQSYNNGPIRVSNIEGEVTIESYNGGITAEDISGSVVANTYNGPIKVIFNRVTAGTPLSFTTYNGDVDITFPAAFKGNFKMRTDRGEIFTGFDMSLSAPEVRNNQEKEGGRRTVIGGWVTGSVNGGGPEVMMRNYNGDIYIRKK